MAFDVEEQMLAGGYTSEEQEEDCVYHHLYTGYTSSL